MYCSVSKLLCSLLQSRRCGVQITFETFISHYEGNLDCQLDWKSRYIRALPFVM